MDEEEKPLYYGIIGACIIGITITSLLLLQSNPVQEEFSELYFYFERIDLVDGRGSFHGCTLEVSTVIWIDLNKDGISDAEEIFLAGDTFLLEDEFWNISDLSKDSTQILFGKFPKEVHSGSINFSFVIANHLAEDHLYEYSITINGVEKKESIFVKKGEKKVISQSLSVSEGEYILAIALDTGEEIHVYLSVKA